MVHVVAVTQTSQLRVLLAEDNQLNQKVMSAFLEHLGHKVTLAVDGHEAFHAATSQTFDVLLVDIQLPGMNGADVVAALRGTGEALPHIVAVTAMARSDGAEFYGRQGFDSYLSKPVELGDLKDLLGGVAGD